ncbi:MAG: FecR family protein [Planctomycetia bacterium]|nr:FecR family protein [Planctomycetia bacterium]
MTFDELMDAYLLREISAEQFAELQELLDADPVARSRFVQTSLLEARLHHALGSTLFETASSSQRLAFAKPAGRMFQRGIAGLRRLDLAAVAVLAVVAVAIFYVARPNATPGAVVISGTLTVDGAPRTRVVDGSTLVVSGQEQVIIELADGTRATLYPGTELTIRGSVDNARQAVQLHSGGGRFDVGRSGDSFRADTPLGSAVARGTQFTAVLRSSRSLFLYVAEGKLQFDGEGQAFSLGTGETRIVGQDEGSAPPSVAADIQVEEGWIQTVDAVSKTFVVGGRNEHRTTFHVAILAEGNREAAQVYLDGKRTTFDEAIKPQRKATVTFVKTGDEPWVWKVEVISALK